MQQLMDRMSNPGKDERHKEVTEEIRVTTVSTYKKKLNEKKTKGIFHLVSLRSHSNENKGLSQVFPGMQTSTETNTIDSFLSEA